MWLSLCCIHVIIKYYELRKYTNEKIENRVLKATNKIEKSCAFGAIRQGMIMLIPLLVVGYGALMIMSLPIAGYQDFIAHIWSGHVMDMLQFIYHGVNDIFAVLLAVTTSVSYALIKSRKKSGFVENGGVRFVNGGGCSRLPVVFADDR